MKITKFPKRLDVRNVVYSRDKQGYMTEVRNVKGKKKPLVIVQGDEAGFTARETKRPWKAVARAMKAEKLALYLAAKGHKKITFLD
jgi:hypothetical protein